MVINRIMCKWKILTDLCLPEKRIKIKNTFVRVVCIDFVVKYMDRS